MKHDINIIKKYPRYIDILTDDTRLELCDITGAHTKNPLAIYKYIKSIAPKENIYFDLKTIATMVENLSFRVEYLTDNPRVVIQNEPELKTEPVAAITGTLPSKNKDKQKPKDLQIKLF